MTTRPTKRLQTLVSTNIDSSRGWEEAADHVQDPDLRSFFHQMSEQRRRNADELRQYIAGEGESPVDSGSIVGQLHRWWIDARQTVNGGDAASVLREVERGEDAIKNQYERALGNIPASDARTLVERQYQDVRRGHDQVKAMRDRYRNPRG